MEVGIRELKQHLSEYLDRAERGEVVTVTDRGVPKAVLGPLPGPLLGRRHPGPHRALRLPGVRHLHIGVVAQVEEPRRVLIVTTARRDDHDRVALLHR